MPVEVKVPTLGESITEATIARWLVQQGATVRQDQPLVELETDKVTVEVNAPASGVLSEIIAPPGHEIAVGALLAVIVGEEERPVAASQEIRGKGVPSSQASDRRLASGPVSTPSVPALSPAVRKLVAETQVDSETVRGTGKGGRLTKGDVLAHLAAGGTVSGGREERVKMTRLRRRVAERLKEAQNTAAILTTFNEVDMTAVIDLRNRHKETFEKRHGVKLGFMSFFVKAAVVALQEIPAVNGEIAGDDIIYKNHYDIGVAVGGPSGLVVPVVREADHKSFADIEKEIATYGKKAREGKLTLEDLQGGTFTVSNGGVYGSLLSTPILNPPQSGILGMHKTQARPVVLPDGAIAARPMMYLALSYDHRIIDGKEAVTFLVRIKDCIEDPARILMDV